MQTAAATTAEQVSELSFLHESEAQQVLPSGPRVAIRGLADQHPAADDVSVATDQERIPPGEPNRVPAQRQLDASGQQHEQRDDDTVAPYDAVE